MSRDTMLQYPDKESITDVVRCIRASGYTAANASYAIGTRNRWLDASEGEIRKLKKALAEQDVDFYDIMVWTNLLHPDRATREKNITYVCEAFEAAERCGVRSITGITGSCGTGHYIEMHPDNWTKETWKLTVDVIRTILKRTAGFSTVWGMEQCITTNIDSPSATKQILEDVADPRCKVVLDPTNMMNLARYYRSGEIIDESFDLLGEDIVGGHAKDFRLDSRMLIDLKEVPPGKGLQDYEILLARLSRMSWPRTLMLEHFPAEEYPPARRYIMETAAKTGVEIYGEA
jgi:sugar phosphate isomerase/epimerase